jgi:hypothetical protein
LKIISWEVGRGEALRMVKWVWNCALENGKWIIGGIPQNLINHLRFIWG